LPQVIINRLGLFKFSRNLTCTFTLFRKNVTHETSDQINKKNVKNIPGMISLIAI